MGLLCQSHVPHYQTSARPWKRRMASSGSYQLQKLLGKRVEGPTTPWSPCQQHSLPSTTLWIHFCRCSS